MPDIKVDKLCVANSYSSCYREVINPSAVTLPAEFIQLDWKFGHDASNLSRRITVKRFMGTMNIVIGLIIRELSLQINSVPE